MEPAGELKIRQLGRPAGLRADENPLVAANKLLHLLRDLWDGRPYVPHGVFRFKSHEEADEWMMQMLTRRERAARRWKTSSPSAEP